MLLVLAVVIDLRLRGLVVVVVRECWMGIVDRVVVSAVRIVLGIPVMLRSVVVGFSIAVVWMDIGSLGLDHCIKTIGCIGWNVQLSEIINLTRFITVRALITARRGIKSLHVHEAVSAYLYSRRF